MWIDIASIVFICVTMNHLGIISAIEGIVRKKLIVLNCPKCSSFWFVVIYGVLKMGFSLENIISLLAISFLASYTAIWLELIEGLVDIFYLAIYETIYDNTADTSASDAD